MIHLDAYEWDNETFVRVWDTNNPDSLMESVERPPARIPEPLPAVNPAIGYWILVGLVVWIVIGATAVLWK